MIVLCCFGFTNCKEKTKPTKRTPATKRAPAKTRAPAKRVEKSGGIDMKKEHFRLANEVLDAVIEGRLKKAQKAGAWLADPARLKEIPKGWEKHWVAVQNSGKELTKADNQQKAALVVAKIASACGSCHVAMKAKPKFKEQKLDTSMGGTKAFMRRHIWATARLWEGLAGPHDANWVKGADALAKDKGLHKKVHARGKLNQEIKSWAKMIYGMGKKAKKTKGQKERTDLFGGLLQGCFHCHQRMYVDLKQFPY